MFQKSGSLSKQYREARYGYIYPFFAISLFLEHDPLERCLYVRTTANGSCLSSLLVCSSFLFSKMADGAQ